MTQLKASSSYIRNCCELLSNLYLCIGWHSRWKTRPTSRTVVNCFQICIFVSDDTANHRAGAALRPLWIAFKFVSLYRMTQLLTSPTLKNTRCELLSNLYLCIGWHSSITTKRERPAVVNCFQICIFVSDDTAQEEYYTSAFRLWIAFKFVSLYRMTQPSLNERQTRSSCELLSNLYLCIGWHSHRSIADRCKIVVNCFQICIFVSDDTAVFVTIVAKFVLWIAFKFVSLYRMTQHSSVNQVSQHGCELLSNLYLCIGWHSCFPEVTRAPCVVNCFQICIFVSDDTAWLCTTWTTRRLWIAFKFVSLYRMTQLNFCSLTSACGCELLSNLYLCIGWHSLIENIKPSTSVVNCFQICIFVSDDTADVEMITPINQLWIAFKFVSLYRMTQPTCSTSLPTARCELLSNLYLCIGWHSI